MATLEALLEPLALDQNISIENYVRQLKQNGYRTPKDILDARDSEDLSKDCSLLRGDAKRIWNAAVALHAESE